MIITSVSISNLRCHEQLLRIPLNKLSIFIGENDAGKTVILDALELLITSKRPADTDYRKVDERTTADKIVIEGTFEPGQSNNLNPDLLAPDGMFQLRKIYNIDGSSISEVLGMCFSESRFNTFQQQNATTQRELLEQLGVTPAGNAPTRIEQFQKADLEGKIEKNPGYRRVDFNEIQPHLPQFERISSSDYQQPHLIVQKTLQSVVNACLYEMQENDEEPKLIPQLSEAKDIIKEALDKKLAEAKDTLKKVHDRISEVYTNPKIDFAKSVSIPELTIDCNDGQGAKPVSSFGEGTKKRLWMGLLDWQRKAELESDTRPIIRAYDEPDTSLHYENQRQLFSNILSLTSASNSNTQAIVCTHSLALIDRAPGESINLIRVSEDGKRSIEFLAGSNDEDVRDFLTHVGRTVGVSNSALFFERAFLIVEGESEENSLPMFYKQLHGRSLVEDGIVLVNLLGSGAWKGFLKLLGRNKADVTVMLLDADCQNSGAAVTRDRLVEAGFPADFASTNCFFIGLKEFEDAFATNDILTVLAGFYPRDTGTWQASEIDGFRTQDDFMNPLLRHVRANCGVQFRSSVRKPDFAQKLARVCNTQAQIPNMIQNAFSLAREKAGW